MSNYHYNFKTTVIPGSDRVTCMHTSNILNIGFVSDTGKITLSYNLEKISLDDAIKMLNYVRGEVDCKLEEVPSEPLDLNIICTFEDKSNENVENTLHKIFGIKPMGIKKGSFGMSFVFSDD